MASSDEEVEVLPDCVTDYHFVDEKGQPVSFSVLPLQWSNDETPEGLSTQAFLRGTADDGLQQIYKKVIAWKLELSYVLPEIYVLTKENWWIKLQRPRKSFQDTIKTILITIHCLHHVKKNPEVSRDALWNHMLKAFSCAEGQRFGEVSGLFNLYKSMETGWALIHLCPRNENRTTKGYDFFVDVYDINDGDDECDNSQMGFLTIFVHFATIMVNFPGKHDVPSISAHTVKPLITAKFCDIIVTAYLICEGRCIRSFHATADAGAESFCESLGFTDAQVEAMPSFLCKNCQYQQHQCFACGMLLGSSSESSGAEQHVPMVKTKNMLAAPNVIKKASSTRPSVDAEMENR
ncbi:hypothetical protein RJ640_006067 [Escallonia rubra]|uniref:RFTS domain-containing protein n=1 Tax=Escallonia rubra TaxID=112253 RepID=A0AA88R9R5_9ASTE|nr:hypothetical protein RJ640_006067 [Escallonia rubra]